jgi:hypothetical protein
MTGIAISVASAAAIARHRPMTFSPSSDAVLLPPVARASLAEERTGTKRHSTAGAHRPSGIPDFGRRQIQARFQMLFALNLYHDQIGETGASPKPLPPKFPF